MTRPDWTPAQLRSAIEGRDEIAVLDVRDEGRFCRQHLLHAVCAPLSRLELIVDRLVPRLATPIVVVDEAGELAPAARQTLLAMGYENVSLLAGGTRAWVASGHVAYAGTNVPGKALGELVAHELRTPSIQPLELARMLDRGDDVVVLDSRTTREFNAFSIPGARSCPTAELVYRFGETVRSDHTLVVVNCAGRTRSIIGAQTLINAGVANRVVALENSTMGWLLAGLPLDHGSTATAPAPSAPALEWARRRAAGVGRAAGLRACGMDDFRRLQLDRSRTLYAFDVRTPQEYAAGHVPGARSAEGGQLVQALDDYVGTRNARIALMDHDGVRAWMVGSWLRQLGCEEVLVVAASQEMALESGAERVHIRRAAPASVRWVDASHLAGMLQAGTCSLFDLETSIAYAGGHVPGAIFCRRADLAAAARRHAAPTTVVTSRDGLLAAVAAEELTRGGHPALALLGGTDAWAQEGRSLATGAAQDVPIDDVYRNPYLYPAAQRHQAFRDYLQWELELIPLVARDSTARLRPQALATAI